MRANTNIVLKERRQLQLTDFKGVDFSSSPLRVQQNRASAMSNFINEYGVNKKRNGWNELFRIEINRVPQRINGVFYYVNGERKEMLVHAGKRFYRIIESSGTYTPQDITLSSTYEEAKCDLSILKDQRSQAFFNKGKVYIIGCGDYLVYGSWNGGATYELRRVFNNEDTYIPTTTVSIDDDKNKEDIRSSLDDVNCLSPWRRNQLLGREFNPAMEAKEEVLNEDGSIKEPAVEAQEAETSITWTLDSGEIDNGTLVLITLETLETVEGEEKEVTYTIENENGGTTLYKVKKNGDDISPKEECGSFVYETGKITLTIPTIPQIPQRDNIFVTFYHKNEGYAERITNCDFGILFGVNGNTDRLFLSGNADYKNIEFHSAEEDYTYFGDMNTASFGSDNLAINGFERLNDSTLAVFKEGNGQESTIFYQTGHNETYYDKAGNLEKIVGVFPRTAGNIGESVASRHACVNFAGDSLILSQNGVFGVVLANNVATAERYTRERSRSINEKLKNRDLSEAAAIVYKNRYYLALDGVCYVADSRFKYTREDDIDGSYNYEWWFWENVPVRVWANINNELYFGTPDGQVCVFDNEYTDRTYQTTEEGELSLGIDNKEIVCNEAISVGLAENDIIRFLRDSTDLRIYALYLNEDEITVEHDRIFVSEEKIAYIQEGTEVYADNSSGSNLSNLLTNTKYIVNEVDRGDCSFILTDGKGEKITLDDSFRLCKLISEKELYVTNVLKGSFQLKERMNGTALTLTSYNGATPSSIIAKITHKENVVAKWYTPVFDLGTNESSKTLLKMTISTEAEVNGKLSFGYETRSVNKLINAKGINVFSFDNFSFENFSFDTGFASSYSVKVNERNFNFIIFRFISDSDSNCAVNNFTITYKINKQNKGVE